MTKSLTATFLNMSIKVIWSEKKNIREVSKDAYERIGIWKKELIHVSNRCSSEVTYIRDHQSYEYLDICNNSPLKHLNTYDAKSASPNASKASKWKNYFRGLEGMIDV